MQPFYSAIPSSLQAMLNLNGGLIACLSAYATLSNAFQLPALEPQRKYIAHISEAKCLGQTHREIKYTLCHLIWQLSFPSYWIEVVPCTAVVMWAYTVCLVVCSQCRCVYESGYSYCDLAFETVWIHTQHPSYIVHLSRVKQNNIALITSLSVVWGNHMV